MNDLSQTTTELVPANPPNLLQLAIEKGATIEVIERLVALQNQERNDQRAVALAAAFVRAKPKLPILSKDSQASFELKSGGNKSYMFDKLPNLIEATAKPLGEEGLALSFDAVTDHQAQMVTVTAILTHEAGGERMVTMSGPFDKSGNKGELQSIGSTKTYLEKYTGKAVLGLAAAEEDDDGQAGNPKDPPITDKQVDELARLLADAKVSAKKFLAWAGVEKLTDIRQPYFESCKDQLESIKERQKVAQ